MGAYATPFPLFFFGLIIITLIILAVAASQKKAKTHYNEEQNLTKLPDELRLRYQSCKSSDRTWFEEYGDALDGLALESPLAVAIEDGWRAMDIADELLTSPEFSTSTKLLEKFHEQLRLAEVHFAIASVERAKLNDSEVEQ
jgi:hypothetical protein